METTRPDTAVAAKLQLRECVPKLVGKVDGKQQGITVRDWVEFLETEFKENNIVKESDKIAKARASIDYSQGTAGKLVKECSFESFDEIKDYCFTWLDVPALDIHDTFIAVTSISWDTKR